MHKPKLLILQDMSVDRIVSRTQEHIAVCRHRNKFVIKYVGEWKIENHHKHTSFPRHMLPYLQTLYALNDVTPRSVATVFQYIYARPRHCAIYTGNNIKDIQINRWISCSLNNLAIARQAYDKIIKGSKIWVSFTHTNICSWSAINLSDYAK